MRHNLCNNLSSLFRITFLCTSKHWKADLSVRNKITTNAFSGQQVLKPSSKSFSDVIGQKSLLWSKRTPKFTVSSSQKSRFSKPREAFYSAVRSTFAALADVVCVFVCLVLMYVNYSLGMRLFFWMVFDTQSVTIRMSNLFILQIDIFSSCFLSVYL